MRGQHLLTLLNGPDLPEEVLGRACQPQGEHRRRDGAYYTPAALCDYIVHHTLEAWLRPRTLAEIAGLRLLDPACGAGHFLCAAYRRLLDRYLDLYLRQAAAGGPLPEVVVRLGDGGHALCRAERRRILQQHIHGVELSPQAAAAARTALGLTLLRAGPEPRTAEELGELPDLLANIKEGDALLLDFGAAFPPAFTDGRQGFDVVLGNPPYLGGVRTRTRLAPDRRRGFTTARGTIDGSILFQELALRLLSPGGRCGLVVPNKFLSAPYGAAFRAQALLQAELRLLADLSLSRPFPGVGAYPVVYVLERPAGPPRQTYDVEVQRFAPVKPPDPGPRLLGRFTASVDRRRLHTWHQLFSPGQDLVHRLLRTGPPLGQLHEVTASATASEAYALRAHVIEGTPEAGFRLLTSGAISRYHDSHGRLPVRYLDQMYGAPIVPRDCPALPPRRRLQYQREKLIVASLTRRLEAVWDGGRSAGAVPTLQVLAAAGAPPGALRYELALLNSRLLSFLFRALFGALALSGGCLRVGAAQLRSLPIYPLPPEDPRRLRLADGAGRMTALHGLLQAAPDEAERRRLAGQIGALDRAIDAWVYELYGLSEEEVRIVERSDPTA